MKFKLEIDCSSPAFGTTHVDRCVEVTRILADIVKRTDTGKPGAVQHAGNEARPAYALDANEQQTGRYWWDGADQPEASPMGRLLVAAGYYVADTGGGCKAWRKDFTPDGQRHALITDYNGTSLPEPGDTIVGAFYPVWGHEGWDAIRSQDVAEVIAGIAKQEATPDTEESLTEELEIYQQEQGLPAQCASELLHERGLTDARRAFLSRFVDRWEAVMRAKHLPG